MSGRAELLELLRQDPAADPDTIREGDRRLSIGRAVTCLTWRDATACAVTRSADLHLTCGALLDALAVDLDLAGPDARSRDIHLLIDRDLPLAESKNECDQAMRTMRSAVQGRNAHVWYRDPSGARIWIEDAEWQPEFDMDPRVEAWVEGPLLPRLTAEPTELARDLVEAVGDPSVHLYPSEVRKGREDSWAVRVDGLQVGVVGTGRGMLTIGRESKSGIGPQRETWLTISGGLDPLSFTREGGGNDVDLEAAATLVRRLLAAWRPVDVPGLPIRHRSKSGVPYIDEHTVEARLLKGLTRLELGAGSAERVRLVRGDRDVARGSQFPTLWGVGCDNRSLDALLVIDGDPVAIEVKIGRGGRGRHYRRALTQAVLYRYFLRDATGLEPWFEAAGLDRMRTSSAIAVPRPDRVTPSLQRRLDSLEAVARSVDAEVHYVDPFVTPELDTSDAGPEPTRAKKERLSWSLAAALVARWPRGLGRILERHDGGGQYDQLVLQHTQDSGLWEVPFYGPRVSLNREGSCYVFSPRGHDRWVWRGLWSSLGTGRSLDEAARMIGITSGLPDAQPALGVSFASVAAAFLEAVEDAGAWQWRNACWLTDYQEGSLSGLAPFDRVLGRYRHARPGRLPTLADVWCAVEGGRPRIAIDSVRGRYWVDAPGGVVTAEPAAGGEAEMAIQLLELLR